MPTMTGVLMRCSARLGEAGAERLQELPTTIVAVNRNGQIPRLYRFGASPVNVLLDGGVRLLQPVREVNALGKVPFDFVRAP
jgi:hypothetical protein